MEKIIKPRGTMDVYAPEVFVWNFIENKVRSVAERFGFTGGMSAIFVTVILLVVFATLNVTVKTRVPKEYKAQA